jgi:hypothetical protein
MNLNPKLILADSAYFFKQHFGQIFALCMPWFVLTAVVQYGVMSISQQPENTGPLFLLALAFNMLVYPVYMGCLILLMAKRAQNETADNKALTSAAISLWQPFFVLTVLKKALIFFGFLLFVVPGIWAAVKLAFCQFHLVLEGLPPKEALQKSMQTTKKPFMLILFVLALFFTPYFLVSLLFASFAYQYAISPFIQLVVGTLLAFLMLFVDVVLFRVYMSAAEETPA